MLFVVLCHITHTFLTITPCCVFAPYFFISGIHLRCLILLLGVSSSACIQTKSTELVAAPLLHFKRHDSFKYMEF